MADLDLVRQLSCAADYLGVLAIPRADGSVHGSLVKAGVLDDPLSHRPSLGVVVAGGAKKLDHLRVNRRATVVFSDRGRWVAVEGPVRIEGPDEQANAGIGPYSALLRAVFTAAGGTHGDWEAFDRVMAEERRCAVFIEVRKIYGNG